GARHPDGGGNRGHRPGADAAGGDGARPGRALRPGARRSEPRPRTARPAVVMLARGWLGALGRWAFALAMPGAALRVARPLTRFLDRGPSPPFVAAIFAVAWFSGFRPALLSIAVSSVVIVRFFLQPGWPFADSMDLADVTWLALFWAVTVVMAALIIGRS